MRSGGSSRKQKPPHSAAVSYFRSSRPTASPHLNWLASVLASDLKEIQAAKDVLIPSDNTVTTFWITNPDNIYRDNVAAGSEQTGFWIALPEHPTGAFKGTDTSAKTWPRRTALREFSGNVSHSNYDGLMFDRGPAQDGTFNVGGNTHLAYADPSDTKSKQLETVIDNFTSYKNKNAAIWARGEDHVVGGDLVLDQVVVEVADTARSLP